MGKGDKKTKRGKINSGTFGNSRPKVNVKLDHAKKKTTPKSAVKAAPKTVKAPAASAVKTKKKAS